MDLNMGFRGPLYIGMAVIFGVVVGLSFPSASVSIGGINETLANLLRMCVIPIVVSSLIVEVVSFLKSAESSNIKKFIFISLLVSIILSVFAAVMAVIFDPGTHTHFAGHSDLTEKIMEASIVERGISEPIAQESQQNFFDIFAQSVPKNIFGAFSHNKTLQIIFFTIVFALALSTVPQANVLHDFFQVTRQSFLKIFGYVLTFLPLLVFTSTALAVSTVGVQVFLDMIPFLKILLLLLSVVFLANLMILRYVLKAPLWEIFKQLETSMLIAFSGSVLAAAFPALDFFKKFGHTDKQFMKIIAPISMFLNKFGNILYFCLSCFFIGQLYGHPFSPEQILFILSFSIIGGIASAGTTEGITGLLLVSILDPLSIPSEQVVFILSGLDFLVSPFLAIITIQTNIMLLSFFLPRLKKTT